MEKNIPIYQTNKNENDKYEEIIWNISPLFENKTDGSYNGAVGPVWRWAGGDVTGIPISACIEIRIIKLLVRYVGVQSTQNKYSVKLQISLDVGCPFCKRQSQHFFQRECI